MKEFARESALADEPAGVDFDAVVAAMDRVMLFGGELGLGFGEVDVFEEGAGASFFGGVWEFVGADGGDDGADATRREIGETVDVDVVFDGIIKGARHETFA